MKMAKSKKAEQSETPGDEKQSIEAKVLARIDRIIENHSNEVAYEKSLISQRKELRQDWASLGQGKTTEHLEAAYELVRCLDAIEFSRARQARLHDLLMEQRGAKDKAINNPKLFDDDPDLDIRSGEAAETEIADFLKAKYRGEESAPTEPVDPDQTTFEEQTRTVNRPQMVVPDGLPKVFGLDLDETNLPGTMIAKMRKAGCVFVSDAVKWLQSGEDSLEFHENKAFTQWLKEKGAEDHHISGKPAGQKEDEGSESDEPDEKEEEPESHIPPIGVNKLGWAPWARAVKAALVKKYDALDEERDCPNPVEYGADSSKQWQDHYKAGKSASIAVRDWMESLNPSTEGEGK